MIKLREWGCLTWGKLQYKKKTVERHLWKSTRGHTPKTILQPWQSNSGCGHSTLQWPPKCKGPPPPNDLTSWNCTSSRISGSLECSYLYLNPSLPERKQSSASFELRKWIKGIYGHTWHFHKAHSDSACPHTLLHPQSGSTYNPWSAASYSDQILSVEIVGVRGEAQGRLKVEEMHLWSGVITVSAAKLLEGLIPAAN